MSWISLYSFVSTMSYMSGGGKLAHELALLTLQQEGSGFDSQLVPLACLHVLPVPVWVFPPPYKKPRVGPQVPYNSCSLLLRNGWNAAKRFFSSFALSQSDSLAIPSVFIGSTAFFSHKKCLWISTGLCKLWIFYFLSGRKRVLEHRSGLLRLQYTCEYVCK